MATLTKNLTDDDDDDDDDCYMFVGTWGGRGVLKSLTSLFYIPLLCLMYLPFFQLPKTLVKRKFN